MSNRTVVMFSPTITSGHTLYVRSLIEVLISNGQEVVHLTSKGFRSEDYPPVPTLDILRPLRRRENYSNRLFWILGRITHYSVRDIHFMFWLRRNRKSVQLVHLQEYSAWTLGPLAIWCHISGIPIVITIHNIEAHDAYVSYRRIEGHIRKMSLHFVDHIYVHKGINPVSVNMRVTNRPDKVTFIRHGVWESAPTVTQRSNRTLLLLGSIRRNKGIIQLLTAAKDLKEWNFTIAGACEDRSLDLEIKSKLPDNVIYSPHFLEEAELKSLLAVSTACVLPYTEEFKAQSGVLHLAIGHGVPVIVTPNDALVDIVDEFGCGVIAGGFGSCDIANAIRSLEDPDIYSRILDGVDFARSELTWDRSAKATLQSYGRLATSKKRS